MSARERSCGMSISTGPGRPVRAMWKASWMAAGISRGSWIISECLTIGIVIPVTSASWKPSVPISSVLTWPVRKTVGTESMIASAIAVTRLVAPGPLVAGLDVPDAGVVEGVVGRQVRPAGDPEDVIHALGLEALHDGVDRSHGRSMLAAPCRVSGRARDRLLRPVQVQPAAR